VSIALWVVLCGYLGLILTVGLVFARKIRSLEDYFLASRNLGSLLVFLSLAASWVGAASTLVTVDQAFTRGISSFWLMGLPAVLTALAFALVLAEPIRRLPIISLPDLVEMRYGRLVRHLVAVLIVWYMIQLAASQMVALGRFLEGLLRVPYLQALLLGTAVVVVYAAVGGFFSVALTDGLQFGLLLAGLAVLFGSLWKNSSFTQAAAEAVRTDRVGFWNFFLDWPKNCLILLSFLCAWTISPIVWQRIQAARSFRQARKGLLGAAAAFLVVFGLIVAIGILAVPLFSSGGPKPLFSRIILSGSGTFLAGLLFLAVTAAIMSTLDTAINTGALSLTRDIFHNLLGCGRERAVLVSRISTLMVAALAWLVATRFQSILEALGLASEILAEGFFIPGVAMLFMRRPFPTAGLLSVSLGGGYAVLAFLGGTGLLSLPLPQWPYSVPLGLALSLGGFLGGLAWDRRKSRAVFTPAGE